MKRTIILISLLSLQQIMYCQFVAIMEVKEPIEGVCNQKEVYNLISSFSGQVPAVCPVSKDEILARLNNEVKFISENPKHKDKCIVGLVINCKGELVRCKLGPKTKRLELDEQISKVFESLGVWKAGTLDGKKCGYFKALQFKIEERSFFMGILTNNVA